MAAHQMERSSLRSFSANFRVMGSEVFRLWVMSPLIAILLLWCNTATADNGDMQFIERVKAAFVLNIARFVTWPQDAFENSSTPYTLCLYRGNSLEQAVATIRGKRVSGRMLQIDIVDTLNDSDNCTILLIPSQQVGRFSEEVSGKAQRPLLTIADMTTEQVTAEIPRNGIMISMVREGSRIALEVNLRLSQQAGLQLSSQLLKLANIVDFGTK